MLRVFGDYTAGTPASGISGMYDALIEHGAKILPSDKDALWIIKNMFDVDESDATKIHKLLNIRFSDLPGSIRPMIRPNRKILTANWTIDGVVSDRVKDLIDWNGSGKKGFWSDVDGNKAEIVNSTVEK